MATNPFVLFRVLTASILFVGTMFLAVDAEQPSEALTTPPVASSVVQAPDTHAIDTSASQSHVEPTEDASTSIPKPKPAEFLVNISGNIVDVDRCDGLVLWNEVPADWPQFIAAHDLCEEVKPWDPKAVGGWKAFGHLEPGDSVNLGGSAPTLKTGTYIVSQRVVVPSESNPEDAIKLFAKTPTVILQTCIPGTLTTLLVGLSAEN